MRRRAAALTILGGLAVGCLALIGPRRSAAPGPAPPPWPFPDVTAAWGGGLWTSRDDLRGPAIVFYVSAACPSCRTQLRILGNVVAAEGPELWIILDPSSTASALGWIPHRLRGRVVSDASGTVARSLGVSRVPTLIGVDVNQAVRIVRTGLITGEQIRAAFDSLSTWTVH